jgi:CRISPR/Cas system endoribonuclease Cas6 (RAMP superfamily)
LADELGVKKTKPFSFSCLYQIQKKRPDEINKKYRQEYKASSSGDRNGFLKAFI